MPSTTATAPTAYNAGGEPAPAPPTTATAAAGTTQTDQPAPSARTSSRVRIVGDYALGKTLGAGSMGKVKLAHHVVTGERVAVKIVPRPPPLDPHTAQSPEAAKQAAKDANKELRHVREAAMSMLVQHPYICAMHELLVQPTQYLMVLEYVSGGQMLDYIIAHGRLRERVARKFARQIASALAYCHANSIVHRDLKIENILISHAGDIKLIDFGLSNLYNPAAHLNTFAGSLYFAAPELLNARPYTGPEVDVWSLGVVLYVLVCGRVPFDDQSMPALHAKIKRGVVEYPPWLSADCKSLLSRILVTTPAQRATLAEVLQHPWMNLGYTSTPNLHIPHRTPLRVDELDPAVVRGMSGFEFGSDADIMHKLREILNSESYIRACARHERGTTSASTFATTLGSTSSVDVAMSSASSVNAGSTISSTLDKSNGNGTTKGSRRFSGLNFDHYRRKLFAAAGSGSGSTKDGTSSPPPTIPRNMSSASLTPAESASGLETLDPTRGFHPLISVYFMVREKLERERAAREGDDPRFDQVQHAPQQREKEHHSRAPTMEAVQETSTAATPQPPKEKDKLRVPGGVIAPPQPMRLAGAEHVPSPPSAASATTPRERARLADGVVPPVSPLSPIHPTPDKEKGEPVLKMPPVSAHRRSASVQKTNVPPAPVPAALPQQQAAPTTKVAILPTPPASAPPSKISVAAPGPGIERHHTVQISHSHSTTTSGTSGFVRRFGSITSRRRTSSLVGSPPSMPPPPREPREARNSLAEGEVLSDSEGGPGVGRWGTIGRRWKGAKVGTAGAGRVVSEGTAVHDRRPMSAGVEGVVEEREEDEADQQVLEVPPPASSDVGHQPSRRGREKEREDEEFKAVPLKGSFSVATTSTKGAKALRADVRRTLTRMGIPFREIPGGFECAHEPSVVSDKARAPRQVKKKGSKISIGGPKRRPTEPAPTAPPEKALPDRPADGHESVSSSLVHLAAAARDAVEQEAAAKSKLLKDRTPSPVAVKMAQPPATPIRRDFAAANNDAEKDYEHFMKRSALGVRFEIHIVKVPILPLHGVQFHRVAGDGQQYYMLARRVITELKL